MSRAGDSMDEPIYKIERRRFPRLEVSLPVRFKFLDSRDPLNYNGLTRDLGLGGMFIKNALEERKLGKEIALEIDLPDTGVPIKGLKAGLAWLERRPQENRISGFGVEFVEFPSQELERFHTYISKITPHTTEIKTLRPPDFRLSEKEKRNLRILDTLRRKDPISKTEIAQEVNLNIVTISNYIDEYKKKGIIFEKGLDESSGGRRPSLLKINSDYGFLLGAELNLIENYMVVVLVDFTTRVLNKKKIQIKGISGSLHEDLFKLTREVIEDTGVDRARLLGMGLGLTGQDNNFSNLKVLLKEVIPLPLFIEDSYIANVLSEVWLNSDVATQENIIYVGLDGSLSMILKGELYRGSNSGKIIMGLNDTRKNELKTDYCWLRDSCILRQSTIHLAADNTKELGMQLGVKIAFLINLLIPDIVIIGKVPEEIQMVLLDTLREAVKRWSFSGSAKNTKIIPSKFKEDAVALGMAAMVNRDLYTQV